MILSFKNSSTESPKQDLDCYVYIDPKAKDMHIPCHHGVSTQTHRHQHVTEEVSKARTTTVTFEGTGFLTAASKIKSYSKMALLSNLSLYSSLFVSPI